MVRLVLDRGRAVLPTLVEGARIGEVWNPDRVAGASSIPVDRELFPAQDVRHDAGQVAGDMSTGIVERRSQTYRGHAVLVVSTTGAGHVGGDRLRIATTTIAESVQGPVRSDGRTTILVQLDATCYGAWIDTTRYPRTTSWGSIDLQLSIFRQFGSWLAVSVADVHAVPWTTTRTDT